MTAIAIARVQVNPVDLTELDRVARLGKQLGHDWLFSHLESRKGLYRLVEAGVVPFERTAVEEYKRQKLAETNKQLYRLPFRMVGIGCSWHTKKIKHYSSYIPAHALEVGAKALKALNAGKTFEESQWELGVEYLETYEEGLARRNRERAERRRLADLDPFLYAYNYYKEGERHYLAVWDEPDFKLP